MTNESARMGNACCSRFYGRLFRETTPQTSEPFSELNNSQSQTEQVQLEDSAQIESKDEDHTQMRPGTTEPNSLHATISHIELNMHKSAPDYFRLAKSKWRSTSEQALLEDSAQIVSKAEDHTHTRCVIIKRDGLHASFTDMELNLQNNASDSFHLDKSVRRSNVSKNKFQTEEARLKHRAQIASKDEDHTHTQSIITKGDDLHASFTNMELNLQNISDYFHLDKSVLRSTLSNKQSQTEQTQLEYSAQITSNHTNMRNIISKEDSFNASITEMLMPSLPRYDARRSRNNTGGTSLRDSILHNPLGEFDAFLKSHRNHDWLISFRHLDPRYQILKFFNDVAREGADKIEEADSIIREEATVSPILRAFFPMSRASAFSVWRPTSNDAIRKMMTGEATGKGLDVKGKSAKQGKLSGFIPFLQIHDEKHKKEVRWPPKDGVIRIYYKSEAARNYAALELTAISNEMETTVAEAKLMAKLAVSKDCAEKIHRETAFENLKFDVADPKVHLLDDYSPLRFGIRVAERVFFNAYILKQDITRCSEYSTGRPSEPDFQDMNFNSTRKYRGRGPRAVVLQLSDKVENVLCPKSLVVAYEEYGRVTPVASDFDCFLVGTRGVNYETCLPQKQVEMLNWFLAQIEIILDSPCASKSWTSRWLEVLKENAGKEFFSEMPQFGLGDPKSYAIMENVVGRLKANGAVRHGAECFNYCFPQELDDEFLVIGDDLDDNRKVPWKYVNVKELQDMLCKRIEKGYTFPLNPKWILVNHGWKAVYDKMMSSNDECIQKSLDVWYPQSIRRLIEDIHTRFPDGLHKLDKGNSNEDVTNTEARDLAQQQLKRYQILQRAKLKLKVATILMKMRK